jgi:hypothetical protein
MHGMRIEGCMKNERPRKQAIHLLLKMACTDSIFVTCRTSIEPSEEGVPGAHELNYHRQHLQG